MATKKYAKAKAIGKEMLPILGNIGGAILGNAIVNTANNLLKNDPNDPKLTLKKAGPPLLLTVGSAFGMYKVKNPILKNVLQGVTIAGAIKSTKVLLPKVPVLNGLGLTPVSAAANPQRWVYQEKTPVSGMGFPDLGNVQAPENGSGYYIDAPAYMQGAEMNYANEQQFNGYAEEQQFNGAQDDEYIGEIEIL